MRRFFATCLLVIACISQPASAYELPKAKLIAVYFYADWCSNCKILSPQLEQARKDGELDAKPILFVKLNLTDSGTIHQSILLAQALGIASYMQQQGSATGYVALLTAEGKQEITRFDRSSKAADIVTGITKALDAPASVPAAKQ